MVKEWRDISKENESKQTIKPKEYGAEVSYTNMFLLKHSEVIPELQFKSEEAYRLYHELKRKFDDPEIKEVNGEPVFACGGMDIFLNNGIIQTADNNGIPLVEFLRRPTRSMNVLFGYESITRE